MSFTPKGPSADAPPTTAPEPAAIWFSRVRELGDVPDLRVLHLETRTSKPRRWFLPHESFDGARMMQFVLRETRGVSTSLPKLRDGRPPSIFARIGAITRMASAPKTPPMPWRRYDATARGSNEPALGYTLFDPDEVRAISQRAEARGAHINSFLLWALDRAVYREVAQPATKHVWALAVNMRGAVGEFEDLDNVAVAIPLPLDERATPAQVKGTIRACLENGAHWGAWYAIRLLACFGPSRIRNQVTSYYAKPRHASVGTFSSVGPYDIPDAGWIVFAPPSLRTHPIAAGAVNVGGRLAIALHVHPVLGPIDPNPLVERWRGYVEGRLDD